MDDRSFRLGDHGRYPAKLMLIRCSLLLTALVITGCGATEPITTVNDGVVTNPNFSFSVPPQYWEVDSLDEPHLVTLHAGGHSWRHSYIFVQATETLPTKIDEYAKEYAARFEGSVSDEQRKIGGLPATTVVSNKNAPNIATTSYIVAHEDTVYLISGYPENGLGVDDDLQRIIDSWKWTTLLDADAG